jgi:type III restriction enzyme
MVSQPVTVPLISVGSTRNFYPDFLVWKDDDVIAVDTTGGHLLQEKTGRKLLSVIPPKNAAGRLIISFISEGSYNAEIERQDKAGYTVWDSNRTELSAPPCGVGRRSR